MQKRALIIGTGAIGGLYGGMLAQGGWQVSTCHRSDYTHVKENGIKIDSKWGDIQFSPQNIYDSTENISETFDLVVVALKVLPSINTVEVLRPVLKKATSLLLIQNGVFIELDIQKAFPATEIIRALAFVCVSKPSAGYIHHQDYGRLVLGKFPHGESKIARRVSEDFNRVGVNCKVTTNINEAIWKKLLWNAPFNPISVLGGGADTRQILDNSASKLRVRDIMQEVLLLAQADGVTLTQEMIDKNISDTESMTPYKTSMLLDYEAGRSLEVGAILGNAILFADKKNIDVPNLKTLFNQLKTIQQQN
jgi:2-dehydropantoate 2-reductase